MTSLTPSGSPLPTIGARHCLGAVAIVVAGLGLAAPAAGQIVIGGNASPRQAVVIDLGALTGLPAPGAQIQTPGLRYGPVPPPFPDFVPPPELYLPLAVAPQRRPAVPAVTSLPPAGSPATVVQSPGVQSPGVPAQGVPAPELNLPLRPAPQTAPPPVATPPVATPPIAAPPVVAPAATPPPPTTPPARPAATPLQPPVLAQAPPEPVVPEPAVPELSVPELSVPELTPAVPPPPEPVGQPAPVTPLPTPAAPPPLSVRTPGQPPATPEIGDLTPPDQPEILQERPPAPAEGAPEPRIQTVEPPGTDVAALDPSMVVVALEEGAFRIRFAEGSSDPGSAAEPLLSSMVQQMSDDGDIRLEIKAYAGTGTGTPGDARRLSLRRALAIRTFLVDRGIESTRIDVKALGDTAPDAPSDRVDLLLSG